MENYYQRFYEYLMEKKMPVQLINDKIWTSNNYVFGPFGPAFYDYTLEKAQISDILKKNKHIMITFTDGFEGTKNKKWYAVIARKFVHYDEMENPKFRYEIKRGLKNIRVELVNAEFISKHGFECFRKASEKYSKNIIKEEEYKRGILSSSGYPDIVNYWGVFHDQHFIGYAQVHVFGNIEANYSTIKIDPAYLKYYPFYSLLYLMNEHYLYKLNFEYANDGYKSILHTSTIQDFLIKKFNFYKEYTNNRTFFHPLVKIGLTAGLPLRDFTSKLFPRLNALYKLYDASK